MGDIAFLLLLFFLVLAMTSVATPIPLELPRGSASEQPSEQGSSLFVSVTGELFLDQRAVTLRDIVDVQEIRLHADRTTPFSIIHPLLEHLREKGTETIHFVVEERR